MNTSPTQTVDRLDQRHFIITGGPGVGKTSIINYIKENQVELQKRHGIPSIAVVYEAAADLSLIC